MNDNSTPGARLRQLLAGDGLIVAPGVYDGLTATMAARTGFTAA
jgi:2-methylisocitrate lyase-like PEP mutase family enzyme